MFGIFKETFGVATRISTRALFSYTLITNSVQSNYQVKLCYKPCFFNAPSESFWIINWPADWKQSYKQKCQFERRRTRCHIITTVTLSFVRDTTDLCSVEERGIGILQLSLMTWETNEDSQTEQAWSPRCSPLLREGWTVHRHYISCVMAQLKSGGYNNEANEVSMRWMEGAQCHYGTWD